MKLLYEGGTNVYINNPGNMTKMSIMPILGKIIQNTLLWNGLISTKLSMRHRSLEYYVGYIKL